MYWIDPCIPTNKLQICLKFQFKDTMKLHLGDHKKMFDEKQMFLILWKGLGTTKIVVM